MSSSVQVLVEISAAGFLLCFESLYLPACLSNLRGSGLPYDLNFLVNLRVVDFQFCLFLVRIGGMYLSLYVIF